MTGTTISTVLHNSVTIGTASYPAPLTITQTGTILSSIAGAAGLVSTLVANAYLTNNDGVVLGSAGGADADGGAALIAGNGATIGSIGLFQGGTGGSGANGANGGAGAYIASGSSFTNSNYWGPTISSAFGTLAGGSGGTGTIGGTGGTGAIIHDATLSNLTQAVISGGAGGTGTGTGGTGGIGIVLNGGSVLNGGGTITGGAGGTGPLGGAGGAAAVLETGVMYNWYGSLLGGSGATAGAGVLLEGGTLINNDVIEGGNGGTGDAVLFAGTATLVLTAGSNIEGNVVAVAGDGDVMVLNGSTSAGLYLGGLGTSVQNFASLDFAAGAAWTVAGNASGLASGLVLNGFTTLDTLVLTGVTASGASFVTGEGFVVDTGTGALTIDVAGSIASGQTLAFATGATGTELYLSAASTISSDTLVIDTATTLGTTLDGSSLLNITLVDVTGTGLVDVTATQGSGIDVIARTLAVLNSGTVIGGPAPNNSQGGSGVQLAGNTTLTNAVGALIEGGSAGFSGGNAGQQGGTGASLSSTFTVKNIGTIAGGIGGTGTIWNGAGGFGVAANGAGTIANLGTITGGAGVGGDGYAGAGGAGASLSGSAALDNQGLITGGAGGSGVQNYGGTGGTGLLATGANTIENENIIAGGAGGTGTNGSGFGGNGGDGVGFSGTGTFGNTGHILAGNAGSATDGGNGGTGVSFSGSGMFVSSGLIAAGDGGAGSSFGGAGGNGVSMSGIGTFGNTGTIEAGNGGGGTGGGTGGSGLHLTGTGVFINAGGITGGNGGDGSVWAGMGGTGAYISSGTLINIGTISAGANGTGSGTVAAPDAVSFGTHAAELIVDPGAVFHGLVMANGTVADTLALAGTTTATLAGVGTQFLNFKDIDFTTGATWALEGNTLGLAYGTTIAGFALGDTIILDNFTQSSASFGAAGLVLNGTTTLDIAGNFTTADFAFTNFAGGTTIALDTVICYLRGTAILTANGEMPVEHLQIGDTVATRFAGMQRIKWIGRQSFDRRFVRNNTAQIPVRITAGALGEGVPARDLFVSPGHSMLAGEVLVLARDMVNGVTIRQEMPASDLHYYQIELQTHDCVLAEGAWSETYADAPGLRAAFHNAAEFLRLYPDHVPVEDLALCLPRPEAGPALEAALWPIMARATTAGRKLDGWVEEISRNGRIRGWAFDPAAPELPQPLEVLCGTEVVHRLLGRDHRGDLATAGYGTGHCGFTITLPCLRGRRVADITIRRAGDAAALPLASTLYTSRAA